MQSNLSFQNFFFPPFLFFSLNHPPVSLFIPVVTGSISPSLPDASDFSRSLCLLLRRAIQQYPLIQVEFPYFGHKTTLRNSDAGYSSPDNC